MLSRKCLAETTRPGDAETWRLGHAHLSLIAKCTDGPEDIRRLTTAYEKALQTIGLVDRNDPLAEMVAKKIIEIGQTGVRDPADISALAIKELGVQ
jgi:hypothetical protein